MAYLQSRSGPLVAVLCVLVALAGCTGGLGGVGSAGGEDGPSLHAQPDRPATLNNSTAASYVHDREVVRRENDVIRRVRNSSYSLRRVTVGAETRVLGETPAGAFLVEVASSGGAEYTDGSGRNVSSDWGLPVRSLYVVTPTATNRVPLPANWSTAGRVTLVNTRESAVNASMYWDAESTPQTTVQQVDAGNSSILGSVNDTATPRNATVSVDKKTVHVTVRVEKSGAWTKTGVLVVVGPDGAVTVVPNYTTL